MTDKVEISKEQYEALLKGQRAAMAMQAGFDMKNPVTELVLNQHWTVESTIEEITALRDLYKVGVPTEGESDGTPSGTPEPTPRVEEVTGGQSAGDIQSQLSGGTSTPGQVTTPSPEEAIKAAYAEGMKLTGSTDDSLTFALDAALKVAAQTHALDRIRSREAEQERLGALTTQN